MPNEKSTREEFASWFLKESIRFLQSQSPSERNTSGIVVAGRCASFLSDKSLFHSLEKIWNETPRKDDQAGKSFDELVFSDLHLHEHKLMSHAEFIKYLQELAPERFVICSKSELPLEEVLQTATSPLDMEDIGCTFAVFGNHEKALAVASLPEMEEFRRNGIRRTIEMEKLRQGHFEDIDLAILGVTDVGIPPWNAGHIAFCALGRLPYMGYPYPDW